MTAWIFPAVLVIIILSAFALLRPLVKTADVHRGVRRLAAYTFSFSAVCGVGSVIFFVSFSYVGDYLASVLSADFIAGSRAALKIVFGTESVFTSLQMLGAVSLFLFSFASCAFCLYCVGYLILHNLPCVGDQVDDFTEKDVSVSVRVVGKRFVWLSRYLL